MKVLMAATPGAGHVNPLASVARLLVEDGHDVVFLTASAFRQRVEASGAAFRPLPGRADADLGTMRAATPQGHRAAAWPDWVRIDTERAFLGSFADQHAGLQDALAAFPAETIVTDDVFFGVLPMLLGPRAARPSVLVCGTSVLHCRREDRAPLFLGLPPAATPAQHDAYENIATIYDERMDRPTLARVNAELRALGAGVLCIPLFEAMVVLADACMQLSVPSFEFPRVMPASVTFVGALPMIPNQAPIPSWAAELDGTRKVVLVTQGTVANHDFGLLVAPTLAALANEPDVLVVATAGGRATGAIPGPIPANARVADYLPFEWLLPKVDVLVTNGGYGSVNQALSFGIPIVAAGLTGDKADVNARIAWSGAGINLRTNTPAPEAIRGAVRTALDTPRWRQRAQQLAAEFSAFDARWEILRLLKRQGMTRRPRAA